MPLYTVEFSLVAEWTVYARCLEEVKQAARKDIVAQKDALSFVDTQVYVFGDGADLQQDTEVDAVADNGRLFDPDDVEWFNREEIMGQQRERALLARNYSMFEEEGNSK